MYMYFLCGSVDGVIKNLQDMLWCQVLLTFGVQIPPNLVGCCLLIAPWQLATNEA